MFERRIWQHRRATPRTDTMSTSIRNKLTLLYRKTAEESAPWPDSAPSAAPFGTGDRMVARAAAFDPLPASDSSSPAAALDPSPPSPSLTGGRVDRMVAPTPASVPAGMGDRPVAHTAALDPSPSPAPVSSSMRARLERVHRVSNHVGPPSSFANVPRAGSPGRAPPPPRSGDLPVAPTVAPSYAFAFTPHAPTSRPNSAQLLGVLSAAMPGTTVVDDGVGCVASIAPGSTQLGAAVLIDAFEHIVQLDDTKLLLPVGLSARECVFFDIESTGLKFEDCFSFVLGAAQIRGDGVLVEQIVPIGREAELRSLEQFRDRVAGARAVVTFNGRRFDLPFLAARCEMLGVVSPLAEHEHIDLHAVSRRVLRKQLARFSLAALEKKVLDMERVDDLPGREAPAAYLRFLATGDFGPVSRVLEHNRLDLLSMIPLLAKLTGGAAPLSAYRPTPAPRPPEFPPAPHPSPSSGDHPVAPTFAPTRTPAPLSAYRPWPAPPAPQFPPAPHPSPSTGDRPVALATNPAPAPSAPPPDQAADEVAANAFIALGAREEARAVELLRSALHLGLRGAMRRRALRELGRLLVAADEHSDAAEVLEKACAETSGDGEAHALLAELYEERLAQPGHALRHARRAVTLQPWNGPMRERVARLEVLFS